MSLVISLTCALLATLLQQWARRYLKVTQSRYSPHRRARIRAFFAEGVDKFLLPWAVETLPALLHISLFLFFAGLVVFLCNVNITMFKLVLSWVSVCTALYGCITFMPIFRHDSPYYTSLSSSVWFIVIGIAYIVAQVRWWFYLSVQYRRPVFWRSRGRYYELLSQGMQRTAEETALNCRSEIVTRAFMWTFDCLDEDHELERFFSGLPGFRSSKVVDDPLPSLTDEQKWKLFQPLIGLLNRTFSSDMLSAPVKNRRAIVCAKAISPTEIPDAYLWIFNRIVYGDQHEGLRTAEFGRIVRGWADSPSGNQGTAPIVQAILAGIVAKAQRRGGSWFILASNEVGVPEAVLRDYATHGDSLSIVILIYVTRQQFSHFREPSWPWIAFSSVLDIASTSNVQDTSPKLQHEFCALWNQIVQKVQNGNDLEMAFHILGRIRNIYIALHQYTDSSPTQFSAFTGGWGDVLWDPSSYPVCNVPRHIHDVSASTTFARTALHDDAALVSASLARTPDSPPLSIHAPLLVDENPVYVPLLDNNMSVQASFHPDPQTTMENPCTPAILPDPAAAGATRDIDTSARTIPPATPETSTFPSSVPSTGAVSIQNNADLLVHSDVPDIPSSASPEPVLDNILPTGPPPSLTLP